MIFFKLIRLPVPVDHGLFTTAHNTQWSLSSTPEFRPAKLVVLLILTAIVAADPHDLRVVQALLVQGVKWVFSDDLILSRASVSDISKLQHHRNVGRGTLWYEFSLDSFLVIAKVFPSLDCHAWSANVTKLTGPVDCQTRSRDRPDY